MSKVCKITVCIICVTVLMFCITSCKKEKTDSEGINTASEGINTASEGINTASEGINTASEGINTDIKYTKNIVGKYTYKYKSSKYLSHDYLLCDDGKIYEAGLSDKQYNRFLGLSGTSDAYANIVGLEDLSSVGVYNYDEYSKFLDKVSEIKGAKFKNTDVKIDEQGSYIFYILDNYDNTFSEVSEVGGVSKVKNCSSAVALNTWLYCNLDFYISTKEGK